MGKARRPAVSDIFDVKWLEGLFDGTKGVGLFYLGLGEGEAEDDGVPFDAGRRLILDGKPGFHP